MSILTLVLPGSAITLKDGGGLRTSSKGVEVRAGDDATVVAGHRAQVKAGDRAVVVAGELSLVIVGNGSIVVAGPLSAVVAGDGSTVCLSYFAEVSGGEAVMRYRVGAGAKTPGTAYRVVEGVVQVASIDAFKKDVAGVERETFGLDET